MLNNPVENPFCISVIQKAMVTRSEFKALEGRIYWTFKNYLYSGWDLCRVNKLLMHREWYNEKWEFDMD